MTAHTYHTDNGQMAQEHDQAAPQDNLLEPDTDLAGPAAAQAEPDTDLAGPDADLMAPDAAMPESGPDPMAPEADRTGNDDPASPPAIALAPADPEPATSTGSGYPRFAPQDPDGAREPGMAGSSPASPSLVQPAAMVPESVTDTRPAGNPAGAGGPWNEIQAMFVDDPHASVERAAGLVDDRVEELIQSFRARQHSVQSAWQAEYAGTEELRVALQHYRTFWNSLEDLPAQAS
jgi:hypothetical protein